MDSCQSLFIKVMLLLIITFSIGLVLNTDFMDSNIFPEDLARDLAASKKWKEL